MNRAVVTRVSNAPVDLFGQVTGGVLAPPVGLEPALRSPGRPSAEMCFDVACVELPTRAQACADLHESFRAAVPAAQDPLRRVAYPGVWIGSS
jgi:hypothetical protein